jgi:flavin-dependent dehydrogenase
VDLHAPGYYFWATDAERLLDWMVDSVRQLGVDVRLGTLFEQAHAVQTTAASAHTASTSRWQVPLRTEAGEDMLQAKYLVGADGPHSRVAKALGLSVNQHFLFGIEHEYLEARLQENFLHCFIDKQLAPGYIGWALAGVGVSQVGLARRMPAASTGPGARQRPIHAFLEKISPVVNISGPAASVRAGMIPCGGVLPHVARPGAVLVGDAAGMVSPVTAGGIHTALRHGEQVGQSIAAFLTQGHADPAEYLAASYPKFRAKRALRYLFDHCQTDWMFNALLSTRAMRRAAELIYFHRKS